MSKNIFNSVKMTRPKRNKFDLTHDVKLSCNMGELVPILAMEAVPGDSFQISTESLVRMAPLVAPVMHRCDIYTHYFFVPNRLLWDNWENFITNTPDPLTDLLPAFPALEVGQANVTDWRLADYMGMPNPQGVFQEAISAMPFAAYQMIYNEYYRDQNLSDPAVYKLSDGDNTGIVNDLIKMRRRAWEHDYFTAALPFAQKGEAVTIPLGQFEDVPVKVQKTSEGSGVTTFTASPSNLAVGRQDSTNPDMNDGLYAQTSQLTPTTATTVNELRLATRLQEWLEKSARGGSRYVENILSFFGVKSPDSRLQRPEYITGSKSPIVISEVLNTTGTTTAPQGNMAGHGFGVVDGRLGNYYCQEHGYIIGIMSVIPKPAYFQGIPKHFLKWADPFQYFWPQFAHVGEQEVKLNELYAFTTDSDTTVFGYVPRYAEYKFMPNRVCGEFRTSLDFWTFARKFDSVPQLNQDFIECVPRTDPFAVETGEKLYCQVVNKIQAIRPMPKYGTPTF